MEYRDRDPGTRGWWWWGGGSSSHAQHPSCLVFCRFQPGAAVLVRLAAVPYPGVFKKMVTRWKERINYITVSKMVLALHRRWATVGAAPALVVPACAFLQEEGI